ncbi:hypothetical protein J2T12_005125 [Paenibacillus anaericanus]|uniref:hypothetical protein n=1 Tax=Paenibacillus anaericanus TaxID=170367 RepID=UPI0027814208|nr:hypothetical protein [Paenibacillus anaericanus]MDQ0091685.1 hypothetical protein [Paenibacillus anaericanus]
MAAEPIGIADMVLVKKFMVYPNVLNTFERDKQVIQSHMDVPEPYIRAIDAAMDRVTQDIKELKRGFRERGIKVYEELDDGYVLTAKYMCRGFHAELPVTQDLMNSDVRIKMEHYLGLDTNMYNNPSDPNTRTNI